MAAGYHVGSPGSTSGLDPGSFDLWVSRTTGLPIIYSVDADSGGFRWVFGSQVVAPAANKIRK